MEKIKDLIFAIRFAEIEAKKEFKPDVSLIEQDGGTCNFDQPVIDLTEFKKSEIELLEDAKVINGKLSGNFWKGCYFLNISLPGQANLRTRAAEKAKEIIAESGFNVRMYYQAD
jgi:hypothetical protein